MLAGCTWVATLVDSDHIPSVLIVSHQLGLHLQVKCTDNKCQGDEVMMRLVLAMHPILINIMLCFAHVTTNPKVGNNRSRQTGVASLVGQTPLTYAGARD